MSLTIRVSFLPPFMYDKAYINHIPASSKVSLKSEIDCDWQYEQQVSHV